MRKLLVGTGTCGLSAGAGKVIEALRNNPGEYELSGTGCIGMCFVEPLLEVRDGDSRRIYGEVTPEMAISIASGADPADHLVWSNDGQGSHADFLEKQDRLVLRNCGIINPDSMDDYIATGGYEALRKAGEMTPGEIIQLMKDSGLRGRGGAGFPTGMKWSFAASAAGEDKYIICNADEGDPGAFMDRSIIEGDPHAVIEGMLIAARAIGAANGYIYCRAEYPLAVKRLENAIAQAEERGFAQGVHLKVKMGAGAFVCGEESRASGACPRSVRPTRRRRGCLPSPRTTTTWKPTHAFHGSCGTASRRFGRGALRRVRAPRFSHWLGRSNGEALPRWQWVPPSDTWCSASAAASRRTGHSRPCKWAALPEAASPSIWRIHPLISNPFQPPVR